jgi:preprotein translocase subunit YajC
MLFFNAVSPSLIWFLAWRKQVKRMRQCPQELESLSRAAMVANANYVMNVVMEQCWQDEDPS